MAGIEQAMQLEGDTELMKLIVENLNQFNIGSSAVFNIIEP